MFAGGSLALLDIEMTEQVPNKGLRGTSWEHARGNKASQSSDLLLPDFHRKKKDRKNWLEQQNPGQGEKLETYSLYVVSAGNILRRNLTQHTWKNKIKYLTMKTMRKESIKHFKMIITEDPEHCPVCCCYKVK